MLRPDKTLLHIIGNWQEPKRTVVRYYSKLGMSGGLLNLNNNKFQVKEKHSQRFNYL